MVAITCHMEFPDHHCYGGIWPAVDKLVSNQLPRHLDAGFPTGLDAAEVGFLCHSPWRSHTLHRRCPICPVGSWIPVPRATLTEARRSGGSSHRRLLLVLEHMGRDCHTGLWVLAARAYVSDEGGSEDKVRRAEFPVFPSNSASPFPVPCHFKLVAAKRERCIVCDEQWH